MDEPAVSSNERRGAPRGNNPVGGADNAQEVVDQARARREAELAVQYQARQLTPVRPTISIELGVATRTGGVPCLILALCNVRLPKDFKGPRKVPNYTADLQPGRGLKVTRWPWSYWRLVMRRWLNISP